MSSLCQVTGKPRGSIQFRIEGVNRPYLHLIAAALELDEDFERLLDRIRTVVCSPVLRRVSEGCSI